MTTSNKLIGMFFVILIPFLLEVCTADLSLTQESDKMKPWHDLVLRRFYGPWTILHNKNGDYIDYNDYGGHIQESQQLASADPPYKPSPIATGYDGEPTLNYGGILPEFSSIYTPSPVGFAVFRTGIPSGRMDETRELPLEKDPENEGGN